MEFFIQRCKFLKVQFLQSPKIHDYSLKLHETPLPLERTLRHLHGGSHQRSLSNHPRRACLNPMTSGMRVLGGKKANMANNRNSNYLTDDTLLTIIDSSDPQVRHRLGPRHVPTDTVSLHVNYLQLTRMMSEHPELSFNLCDFTCQHVIARPIRTPQ